MEPQTLQVTRTEDPVTVECTPGAPITMRKQSSLDKRTVIDDNDNEFTIAVEYRLPGTDNIVHRSAHTTLKKGLELFAEAGSFGQ